jgi:hypothetical protein
VAAARIVRIEKNGASARSLLLALGGLLLAVCAALLALALLGRGVLVVGVILVLRVLVVLVEVILVLVGEVLVVAFVLVGLAGEPLDGVGNDLVL